MREVVTGLSSPVEHKAVVVEQRTAARFGMALRLQIADDEGATHDLSSTGIYFESDRRYEPGEKLDLRLEFHLARQAHSLKCEAEVVRCVAAGEGFNTAVRLLTPLYP